MTVALGTFYNQEVFHEVDFRNVIPKMSLEAKGRLAKVPVINADGSTSVQMIEVRSALIEY